MRASGSSARDSIIESPGSHLITRTRSLRTLCTFKTSFGTAVVGYGIPPREYETWVAGFENYPLDHRYYEIIHESLKDHCTHYYLFLKDANGMTRAIQPFLIVKSRPCDWNSGIYSQHARSSPTNCSWIFEVTNADGGMLRGGRRHCFGESESQCQLDGGCAEGELNSCRSPAEVGPDCLQGLPEILPPISG